jgi:hypothetical protein
VFVFTEDLSSQHHDLCAAFHRAVAGAALADIPPGKAIWRIRLEPSADAEVDVVQCRLRIDTYAQAGHLAVQRGAASVRFAANGRNVAESDCIDALLQDLVTKLAKSTATALRR